VKNQIKNLHNSYENFEYFVSHQISLKILPLGTKNKTTDEIKHYCTECGTKTKSKYKFCPSCGNKIINKKGPVRPFFYFKTLSDFETISDSVKEYKPFLYAI
jgi:predicted RNA-binding Zn-ribbon protein involved in translation (DUF1610 family)